MKPFANRGMAALNGLGLTLILGVAAHASLPYLPLIGPPPLRLLASRKPNAAVVKIATLSAAATAATSNTLAVVEAKNLSAATNAGVNPPPTVGTTAVTPVTGSPTDWSSEHAFSDSVFGMPTPDLLGITPQMLASYFHPVNFDTNTAPQAGLLHVSFLPPLPPPPALPKSSHAEYIVK